MKKEYTIEDTWVSYELHPETPPAGLLLSERFKGYDLSSFHDQLRARGREVGVVFGDRTLLSNSRSALMASEFARDLGQYSNSLSCKEINHRVKTVKMFINVATLFFASLAGLNFDT